MSILAIKYLHISCALASYTLFFIRGIWMLQSSPMLQARWVRIAPHIVDTILLASAIAMAYLMSLSPLANGWLSAKIVALLLYIVLGTFALKRGKTRTLRLACWIAAQLVFLYIVLVAVKHSVLPWIIG